MDRPTVAPENHEQIIGHQADGVTLADLTGTLWRRKLLIVGVVAGVALITLAVLGRTTPRFTAEALVIIENRGLNIAELESVATGLPFSDEDIADTELQVFRSRGLADRVIDDLGLASLPEFNPDLRRPGTLTVWRRRVASWFESTGLVGNPRSAGAAEVAAPQASADADPSTEQQQSRSRLVANFQQLLDVTKKSRSRVISVKFNSRDPKTAARVANALAQAYIDDQVEAKLAATRQANAWLNERVSELRSNVAQAEAAVEAFRRQSGLLQTEGVTLISREISELNTHLLLARTERAAADARLTQVEKLIEDGRVDSVAEVLGSELIQDLRAQEAVQQGELAELSQEYGELHPRMIKLRAEASDLETKIQTEVSKIVEGIRNELAIAQTREASLETSVAALKNDLAQANANEVQLRAFQREAEANRALLTTFLARYKETDSQQDASIQQPDARVLATAGVPFKPTFPRTLPILGLAVVGATVFSIMLVFVLEQFDRGYRSSDQVLLSTGLPVLSLVPKLGTWAAFKTKPAAYVARYPGSALSESMRTLCTRLGLLSGDRGVKSVLITSASPKEGKTALAACLARVLAMGGHRVLLVDADLRVPSAHDTLQLARIPGLSNVLGGAFTLAEAVQVDSASGAHVLTAGAAVQNPTDLLQSAAMDEFLRHAALSHDAVIIDSPPTRAVSDAAILAGKVDATVFAIRWASTRRETADYGLQQIRSAGHRVAGVALSIVDVKKHARYGYPDSGCYAGDLARYYTRAAG